MLKNSKSLGKQAMMENVTVRDCKVTSCTNAFKIGTETSYDISGVTVENCEFFMDDIYPSGVSGISIESADGAKVEHVEIRNIQMRGVACPLFVRLNNRNRDRDFDNTGAIQNVKVETLTADGIEIPRDYHRYKEFDRAEYHADRFQLAVCTGGGLLRLPPVCARV